MVATWLRVAYTSCVSPKRKREGLYRVALRCRLRRQTFRSVPHSYGDISQRWKTIQESPLPLTDPRDAEAQRMLHIPFMAIKRFLLLGLAAEYRSRRWVWLTVVRRPSEVYDTHRRTKMTAPETISLFRHVENPDMNLPHLYLRWWWPRWNFAGIVGVTGLSYFVLCVILGLTEHRLVIDGRTDRHMTTVKCTALA